MRFALPLPQKTTKFGSNKSLTNNFLHCEFQFSILSNSKVLFWGRHFREFDSQRIPKFSPNNCLANNFLHYEFQPFMLSSSKVSFWGRHFREVVLGSLPPEDRQIFEFQLSMFSSSKVFNFLCWAVQKFHFGRFAPSPQRPKFGPNNCSQTTSYIVTFNFLCSAFQNFHFEKAIFEGFAPQRTPKFGPNNCLTNNCLHYEFQLSMFSCSNISLRGWGFAPQGSPNLVQTIVSQTTS